MLSRGNRGVARLVSCARARRIVRQAERPSLTRRCAAGAPGSSGLLAEQLPKAFDHAAVEDARYRAWEEAGAFQPRPGPGEPFVVAMPPPNVTGALHMGHAMFVTVQDIMVRWARMNGRPTLWLPGTDHAGIATQLVVERLLAAEGTSRQALGRDAFLERVWAWKAEYGHRIGQQIRRLGASCDWSRERFTLDAGLSAAVAHAFCTLHARGLVYKGTYMVNWAPLLQTAVSDLEVEYSEEAGTLYVFRYVVEGTDDHVPVATTRPETIPGDSAVAVHPEDDRFRHLVGRRLVVPCGGGRTVPLIADEYVDREFGTGALKVTPGHDVNDYALGKRHGLPVVTVMAKDGTMNAAAGAYAGLDRAACRERIWADIRAAGLALREEPHMLRVPRSQRGGEVIEPLVSDQWFLRMDSMAAPALAALQSGALRIIPPRFEKTYASWLGGIQDWCVSRQLWWGHRIPVWYVHPNAAAAAAATADGAKGASDVWVVAHNEAEAAALARARHGPAVALVQETDVLDTWFSSGLWPFSALGWPERTEALARFYPTSVLETGHDILFFWVARMVMLGIELTGEVPFGTVFLHGLVRDEKGRKMSKSLGNVVDPLDCIATHGADALRFALATGSTPGQDTNLSAERLASSRGLATKLWNAVRFTLLALDGASPAQRLAFSTASFHARGSLDGLPLAERWLLSRLGATAARVHDAHGRSDLGEAGRAAADFFWTELADWFLEAAKTRLSPAGAAAGPGAGLGDRAAATASVAVYALGGALRLLHPFMPFVTEELWQALPNPGGQLVSAPPPPPDLPRDLDAEADFAALQAIVRNARAEYSVEPARRVPAVVVVPCAALRAQLAAEAPMLALLARVDPTRCDFVASAPTALAAPGAAVTLLVQDGVAVLLPVAGLADPAKELQRLGKQAERLAAERDALAARLGAPGFTDRAPASVVAKVRDQCAQLDAQLAELRHRLDSLRAQQQQ